MICEIKGKHVPVKLWTQLDSVESEALSQLKNIASLPWVFKHVAAMPDVHYGKGATVGSVIAMKNAISPAAMGVDISCGMGAFKTNLNASMLPDSLKDIRAQIEGEVPVGFASHSAPAVENLFSSKDDRDFAIRILNGFSSTVSDKFHDSESRMKLQVGTLGGGNHFIELCLDEGDNVWLLLHSGSRNIGKVIAEHHISIARGLIHNQELPDKDLAVFLSGTEEMREYMRDVSWASDYAMLNRMAMLELCARALRKFFPQMEISERVLCHHNYVSRETHFGEDVIVTRKGAISAREGQLGLIPGSMGTRSYVVKGLGNPDSFCSASHGAGRRMSRGKAKKHFTVQDLADQTVGVECRKDAGVLDEIPGAYKDIDVVMENQKDLVQIVHSLKQVLSVKG